MSFLDATGLGTFWAKLKNYFIPGSKFEGPVTGLTDILTPMNILPNAAFNELALIESPLTIASATNNTAYTINSGWSFQVFNGTASNVTITISSNSVRITGTLNSAQSTCQIRIYNTITIKTDRFYTFTIKIKLHSTTLSTHGLNVTASSFSGSSSYGTDTEYNNTEKQGVVVFKDTDGSIGLGGCLRPGENNTGTFDIEFSDACLYEGEFKNPPVKLDNNALPSTVLFTQYDVLGSLYRYKNLGSIKGPKWIRLVKLRKQANRHHYVKFFVSKASSGSGGLTYEVEAVCYMDNGTVISSNFSTSMGIYAKGIATTSANATNRFTKFRFAMDSDTNYYVEGYFANSTTDSFYVNVELYHTYNTVAVNPTESLIFSSVDGTNDTTIGSVYGYYLFNAPTTYIQPS